ncbi:MAG: hypothetical protein ACK5MR_00050 [Cumulibacter sp.]
MSNGPARRPQSQAQLPVRLGCAVLATGTVLIFIALILRAISGINLATKIIVITGFGLAAIGLFSSAAAGWALGRNARRQYAAGGTGFESVPADRTAIRAIESARLTTAAAQPDFPSTVVASYRVPVGALTTYFAANVPVIRVRRRSDQRFEPPATYQWIALPVPLPRLLITHDLRGQSAILGPDINIENEAFNRRFRIDSSLPLTNRGSRPQYGDFARYATAVLHPRVAQLLSTLPENRVFVVTGGYAALIGPPDPDVAAMQHGADALAAFQSLLPPHVLQRWAGSEDYRPTAD